MLIVSVFNSMYSLQEGKGLVVSDTDGTSWERRD